MAGRDRTVSRRRFLGKSLMLGGAISGRLLLPAGAQGAGVEERLRLGFIGLGGRGRDLLRGFQARTDCVVQALCDVHEDRLGEALRDVSSQAGREPAAYRDVRAMLGDSELDAVVIATPDHWHCLAAAWACRAGKHVYVEKPLSHNVAEGRRLVEIAREHDRVVQVGTQNRSAPFALAARDYIQSGKLGRILLCKVYNQKEYGRCRLAADGTPPPQLDWNLWNGPCTDTQFNETRYGNWHDFWRYSGGDVCNDGVHQLDLACMVLGLEKLPRSVTSTGYAGRDSDAEVPYVMLTNFAFDEFPLTFQLTLGAPYMLKTDPEIRQSDLFPLWQQNATRIEIFGTEGVMMLGRHGGGWQVFDRPKGRQPVVKDQMFGRFPDPEHKEDFVQAIRAGRRPNADVEHGHRSAALCHLANISYRIGNWQFNIDPASEQITGNAEAQKLLARDYRPDFSLDADLTNA